MFNLFWIVTMISFASGARLRRTVGPEKYNYLGALSTDQFVGPQNLFQHSFGTDFESNPGNGVNYGGNLNFPILVDGKVEQVHLSNKHHVVPEHPKFNFGYGAGPVAVPNVPENAYGEIYSKYLESQANTERQRFDPLPTPTRFFGLNPFDHTFEVDGTFGNSAFINDHEFVVPEIDENGKFSNEPFVVKQSIGGLNSQSVNHQHALPGVADPLGLANDSLFGKYVQLHPVILAQDGATDAENWKNGRNPFSK